MKRILLIEDNADLAFGLRNNLEIEGYEIDISADGAKGLAAARASPPDLVILDLMLPGMNGIRVLQELRGSGFALPILILTARGEESDKVRGLRLGADDYMTKPFGVLELLARVEALLRRAPGGMAIPAARRETETSPDARPGRPIRFGDVEIDRAARVVTRRGRRVELAPKEFDLLVALWMRHGTVVSRLELLRGVWSYSETAVSRTVDTHIGELRRKLEEDPSHPRYIRTARKAGYRLDCEEPGDP